jgi:DNA-binding beta-propeller fold protein YncE
MKPSSGQQLLKSGACSAVLLGVTVLWSGCTSPPAAPRPPAASAPARVWPPPPAEPRLAYVSAITRPEDLGIRPSGWSRIGRWLIGKARGTERLEKPFGLALDDQGNLCVTDTSAAVVWCFDLARKRAQRWEKAGTTRFVAPVAVAAAHGTWFVADSSLGKVLALDDRGRLRLAITNNLQRPAGLAVAQERLFVADSQLHAVLVFDLQGRFLSQFGRRGAGPGEFNFPTHLAADGRGHLYVTDAMNARLQVFDLAGHFQSSLGSAGDTSGHFSRPKGAASDDQGRLYVVDALFDNLQIFDSAGRFLLHVGETGSGVGEFWMPNGIAISPAEVIYVADSYNHRVQVFKYIGPP